MLRLFRCTRGATAIEYALIVSILVVGLLSAFQAMSGKIDTMFTNVSNQMG